MNQKIEQIILRELIQNDVFSRKVLPYLKSEYFSDPKEKLLFEEIQAFIAKYNVLPKIEALIIEIDSSSSLNDNQIKETKELIKSLKDDEESKQNQDWLVTTTEKFCKEKAIYNAMMESIEIMHGKTKKDTGAIPGLLSDALAVSFDPNVGHDYIDNADQRYDYYHLVESRIPFDIQILNEVTKGGLPKKTLTVILAGINVGKSLMMCHMASANLAQGKNVLYITLEMAEEKIAERIDANLLNIDIDTLMQIPKADYDKRISKLKSKTNGKLIIKEYPTSGASVLNFKALLNELALKKKFVPDIIYIDYINICASARVRMGGAVNTYSYIKSIAEELRGLAVELQVPIVTATQVTRTGFNDTDIDMTDTAESFGLPATADFMLGLVTAPELEKLNQVKMIQVKSRFGDKSKNQSFFVGIDKTKFRLYDVKQDTATTAAPSANPTPEAKEIKPESSYATNKFKDKLKDIKW